MSPSDAPPALSLQLRRIGDEEMYDAAVAFAHEWLEASNFHIPRSAQLSGLMQYRGSWNELRRFINHQVTRPQHRDASFYGSLQRKLLGIAGDVANDAALVPEGLTNRQRQAWLALVQTVVTRAFVEHLVAELRYRAVVGPDRAPLPKGNN